MGVAVMGVGFAGAFPTSDGLSYRELIAKAALTAYRDAGVDPEQVDGAVSVEYAVLVALIVGACISTLALLGETMSSVFGSINDAMETAVRS